MSENTRRLMGDPSPGRTPWAPAPAKVKVVQRPAVSAHAADDDTPIRATIELTHAVEESMAPPPVPTQVEPEEGPADPGPELIDAEPLADSLREIAPIDVSHLDLVAPPTGEPIFERVDPRTLLIDGSYQRDLSPASLRLIERIAANWDWRRFKPPVVAFADGGLQIIDGQHTSIAAASRADIAAIPIMVVEAPAIEARAGAFIGHNKDRLAVSPMQLHHAAVAAGEPEAVTIENVCTAAGVHLVRSPYGGYNYGAGDSVAIAAIRSLIRAQGPDLACDLLKILVAAELAPLKADHIKAVELLFSDPDYRDQLEFLPDGGVDVAAAIKIAGDQALRDAKVHATTLNVPVWRGLAIVWFRKSRKRRRTA